MPKGYLLCSFYPKSGTCDDVYNRALRDDSILSQAAKNEYLGYARYLRGASDLSDSDRQFLKENGVRMPDDLSVINQAGLHNVINDPALKSLSERLSAVNNFLIRADSAELYCHFNDCKVSSSEVAANEGVNSGWSPVYINPPKAN